jgi:hypothetical protein
MEIPGEDERCQLLASQYRLPHSVFSGFPPNPTGARLARPSPPRRAAFSRARLTPHRANFSISERSVGIFWPPPALPAAVAGPAGAAEGPALRSAAPDAAVAAAVLPGAAVAPVSRPAVPDGAAAVAVPAEAVEAPVSRSALPGAAVAVAVPAEAVEASA